MGWALLCLGNTDLRLLLEVEKTFHGDIQLCSFILGFIRKTKGFS